MGVAVFILGIKTATRLVAVFILGMKTAINLVAVSCGIVYRGWGISSNMIVGIVYVGSSRNRYISKLIIYIFLGGV